MSGKSRRLSPECLKNPGSPDVCMTPGAQGPIPTPYPNAGQISGGSNAAQADKVKIAGKKVDVGKTKVGMSAGDEAGTLKGMISSKNMKAAGPLRGAGEVEALPVLDAAERDASDSAGKNIKPSQSKVKVGS